MKHTLEEVLECLVSGVALVTHTHQRNSCYCDLCIWSSKAEEIIAKAEGETPCV